MTYSTDILDAGRRPIIAVVIDLDQCANTFSVAPCTAAAPPGLECFNTLGTCQDPDNYDSSNTFSLVLTDTKADILSAPVATPGDVYIPCIDSIRTAPEKITPGKGMGYRGKVTITCLDFPHHDINIDPYLSTRSYTPVKQGTFFGKLLARNKHYVNRPIKIRQYFHAGGRTSNDYREMFYIIDTIVGPDSRGRVTITAKDPLILTEALKAQCPVASTGTLSAALVSGTTTTFSLNTGEGAGYPAGAHVIRINDEIISITSRSGDTFTIASRGHGGTTAEDHEQDDTVQLCYVADGTSSYRVDLVLAELLEDYAAMPSAYIPAATWATEASTWASGYNLESIISEPTTVADLISEILVETNSSLWWSASEQLIKWETQTPDFTTLETLSDRDIIDGSVTVKRMEKDRISQVLYYSGVRNWAETREPVNYRSLQVRIDATGESDAAYQSPSVKKIFARWMQAVPNTGEVASRYLARFKNPPELITTEIDLKDIETILTGDHIYLTTDRLQDEFGAADSIEMQVLSIQHDTGKETLRVEAMRFRYDNQRYFSVGPNTLGDYTTESAANQLLYGFMADTTTIQMSNGDNPYLIT